MARSGTPLSTYLKRLAAKYKFYLLLIFATTISASVFTVSVNYKVKEIIDAIASDPNANTLMLIVLFVFYKLMYYVMHFLRMLLHIRYKPRLLVEIISDMYTKTVKHSLQWFDSHLSGEISSKIADFQSETNSLVTSIVRIIGNVTTIIISLLFLFTINALSAYVILAFIVIYAPVIWLLINKQIKLQKERVIARQSALGTINDSIANIFSIKIIGSVWSEFKLKLTPALLRWKKWERKARQFDAYFIDNSDTIMVTIMSAVQIYLLACLYKSGEITAGEFAFIAIVTLNIHKDLSDFLDNLLFGANPAIASMKSSFTFISSHSDTPDHPDATILSNARGKVDFKNVCFAYKNSKNYVFNGLNLHIPAGQKVGVVGTSGAGKTTLIKSLLRYFDVQSGRILIDDTDITSVTQESLWANISIIPQDITLFHRSVLENLQLAKPEADFDEIVLACKKARIHDDITHMTDGYHSIVGERGVKVSGGQRQRIAIARAILKNAPILILDEATSALDTPTEQLIQESLNEMLETSNATSIVIAHRLSTLLHMDRIIVLDHGKVVQEGKHSELLMQEGLYKTLWNAQSNGFLLEAINNLNR